MMYRYSDGYYQWSAWNWVFMVLMMALFFIGAIFLIRFLGQEWRKGKSLEDPLQVLKARYAKGEIDKKEFEEKKKDLS